MRPEEAREAMQLVTKTPETPRVDPPVTPRPASAPARDRQRERRRRRRKREEPEPETPSAEDAERPRRGRRVDIRV